MMTRVEALRLETRCERLRERLEGVVGEASEIRRLLFEVVSAVEDVLRACRVRRGVRG